MRDCLDSVPDPVVSRDITLFNNLMFGLTVFILNIPSLLEIDELVRANEICARARNIARPTDYKFSKDID